MKIVVLAGGISAERDVSLGTGAMVHQALKDRGHQAVLADVYLGSQEAAAAAFAAGADLTQRGKDIKADAPDLQKIRALRKDPESGYFGPGILSLCRQADIVFIALHGLDGEDGKIQAAFDLLGIRYTGSGHLGSALAMDKGKTKEILRQAGVPVPDGYLLKAGTKSSREPVYPAVVKTCCGGSSVGVYLVHHRREYEAALEQAFTYEDEVVVEEYISGREFSVGVVDERVLPSIEISPLEGFYDYKNKYQAGLTREICPADLPSKAEQRLGELALLTYRSLKLAVYARMDFRMKEDGGIYCLEANTLPGMTKTSLLPQMAAAAGISFEELCEQIIEISLRRYRPLGLVR